MQLGPQILELLHSVQNVNVRGARRYWEVGSKEPLNSERAVEALDRAETRRRRRRRPAERRRGGGARRRVRGMLTHRLAGVRIHFRHPPCPNSKKRRKWLGATVSRRSVADYRPVAMIDE